MHARCLRTCGVIIKPDEAGSDTLTIKGAYNPAIKEVETMKNRPDFTIEERCAFGCQTCDNKDHLVPVRVYADGSYEPVENFVDCT